MTSSQKGKIRKKW